MKAKSLSLLCVAVGCGLVSMLGVKQFMNKNKTKAVETVEVLVATASIAPGVLLDETNTEFKAYPMDSLVEGVIRDRSQVDERAVKSPVFVGDFILEQKLGNKGEVGAATQIPEGMRVITVKVDATTSHSGLLRAGNRVDLMCTFNKRARDGMRSETKVVLQFVRIFATDNQLDGGATDAQSGSSKNVSLIVTPEEAKKFLQAKAMSNNNLHLALRNNKDTQDTESSDLDDSWLGLNEDEDIEIAEDDTMPEDTETESAEDIAARLRLEMMGNDQSAGITVASADMTQTFNNPEMWSIEIFEGDNKRVEQVEVPVDEEAEAQKRAEEQARLSAEAEKLSRPLWMGDDTAEEPTQDDDQADNATTSPKASGFKGLIQSYFAGA